MLNPFSKTKVYVNEFQGEMSDPNSKLFSKSKVLWSNGGEQNQSEAYSDVAWDCRFGFKRAK